MNNITPRINDSRVKSFDDSRHSKMGYLNTAITDLSAEIAANVTDIAAAQVDILNVRAVKALADAAGSLDRADLYNGIFTIAASADRALTPDVATDIIAGMTTSTVGEHFEFTIVNTGGGDVATLTADTGITIVGNAVVADLSSGTFMCLVTGAATVSMIRL